MCKSCRVTEACSISVPSSLSLLLSLRELTTTTAAFQRIVIFSLLCSQPPVKWGRWKRAMDYFRSICLQQVFQIRSTRGTSVLFFPRRFSCNSHSYHKHRLKHRDSFCCLHTLAVPQCSFSFSFLRLQQIAFSLALAICTTRTQPCLASLFLFCCQASSVCGRFVFAQITHATRAQTIAIRMSLNAYTACLLSCFSFVSKHSVSTPVISDRPHPSYRVTT